MAPTSKELLDFTDLPKRPSCIESIVSKKESSLVREQGRQHAAREDVVKDRPLTSSVPRSQVLGRAKDFISAIAESNEKMEQAAHEEHSRARFNMEELDGDEERYIEMDLLLGVADLNTAEAIEAAKAAMAGFQPPLASRSRCWSTDSSDEDDSDEDGHGQSDCHSGSPTKRPDNDARDKNSHCGKPKKKPKIVALD